MDRVGNGLRDAGRAHDMFTKNLSSLQEMIANCVTNLEGDRTAEDFARVRLLLPEHMHSRSSHLPFSR